MIRTALSFCLLFGGLVLVSKWLHQSVESTPVKAASYVQQTDTSEPQLEEPARLTSAHFLSTGCQGQVALVSYDDPVEEVLNSLRPDNDGEIRVADFSDSADRVEKKDVENGNF